MRHMALLVLLVACGKSEDKAAPASGAPAKSQPVDKPVVETGEKEKRICRRLDTDPIAKIVGVDKMTRTGGGSLIKGGGAPASLICNYYEGSKVDGGMSFGFSLRATTELDERDTLGRFKWEPFEGLGQPAQIGRAKDGVHIQTVAKGAHLVTNLQHDKVPVAELETKLVAVTKYLIEQLPADAQSEVR
jgi:hypothetical protein